MKVARSFSAAFSNSCCLISRRAFCSLFDGAAQGRIGLQGGVLHVAGLVTEDGLEELLFRGRIALALRGDLADHDVARLDVGADAHDTVLVEVLGGVLADVRDIGRKFLHAALGLADLGQVFVHVDGSEDVPLHHLLAEDDGVLVVVTLPRHEGDLQVAAERELAVLGGIALGEDLATTLSPFRTSGLRLIVVDWLVRR